METTLLICICVVRDEPLGVYFLPDRMAAGLNSKSVFELWTDF